MRFFPVRFIPVTFSRATDRHTRFWNPRSYGNGSAHKKFQLKNSTKLVVCCRWLYAPGMHNKQFLINAVPENNHPLDNIVPNNHALDFKIHITYPRDNLQSFNKFSIRIRLKEKYLASKFLYICKLYIFI